MIASKKCNILRDKSDQRCERPVHWKLLNITDRNKENVNKERDMPCTWAASLNIVKMSVLPKLIYRFSTIPIKISAGYFR